MGIQHPRREDYGSDVDWWIVCALHLDALFPARTQIRERMRAWQGIEPAATVDRIRDLLSLDRLFTDDEAAEWGALTATYRATRRAAEGATR